MKDIWPPVTFHSCSHNMSLSCLIQNCFIVICLAALLDNLYSPVQSFNVEQFTEDMVEYFGAELPVVLYDPAVVLPPQSLRMAVSFIASDIPDMGMESDVYQEPFFSVCNSNKFPLSLALYTWPAKKTFT